jgi:hypothetical protein
MMALWPIAVSFVGPLAKRVLIALGIGWITYQGFTILADQVKTAVQANMGQLGGTTAQIVNYFGIMEAVGIVLGGLAARAALLAAAKLGKLGS